MSLEIMVPFNTSRFVKILRRSTRDKSTFEWHTNVIPIPPTHTIVKLFGTQPYSVLRLGLAIFFLKCGPGPNSYEQL